MLYHYTDFIALDGIIGNAELRLNNVLNMNDASEMRFYMEGICHAVEERLKTSGRKQKAADVERYFLNEIEEEFNYSAYAACFSKYRDDAAQWERYGSSGHGVCIAFREEMLKKICETTQGVVSLRNVCYNFDFSTQELAEKFYTLIAAHDSLSDCMDELRQRMEEAWITSASFKHPSFANENEVRMVVTPFVSPFFPVLPKYHVSLGRIKKYYPMNLAELCRQAGVTMEDLAEEIIIGPTSTQSPAILQDYLRDKGYCGLAKKVYVSECPLRQPTT